MTSAPGTDRAAGGESRPGSSATLEGRAAGRLAVVGLVLVLTVLTAFAIASDLRTGAAAGAAARSTGLSDTYWQARTAVGAEESLERKYRLEPGRVAGKHYNAAAASFVSAMRLIERRGTGVDRALAANLLVDQRAYRQAIRRMFAAVDSGDLKRVLEIDAKQVDPRFGAIEARVAAAADARHSDALASVRSLERTRSFTLIAEPVAFTCGLLLVALFSLVLVKQRRRTEAAQQAELEAQTETSAALAASNQRLCELDRQKDEFVASVSHELRTPLTSIIGYLAMLRDGESGSLTDEQEAFFAIVERNSNRLLTLVGDLLDASQLEPDALTLNRSRHDLATIVSESISSASLVARDRSLALTLHAEEVPEVEIDAPRLGQAIDNLLSNALKFTPPGGSVDVRLSSVGACAVIELSDTGTGMSLFEQEHIFERFYRSESAVKQAIQGTGLGLWITRSIVEAHGGAISLKSAPGLGTTFRIELPLAVAPELAVAAGSGRDIRQR
jgi:signal transduction histidine kinase